MVVDATVAPGAYTPGIFVDPVIHEVERQAVAVRFLNEQVVLVGVAIAMTESVIRGNQVTIVVVLKPSHLQPFTFQIRVRDIESAQAAPNIVFDANNPADAIDDARQPSDGIIAQRDVVSIRVFDAEQRQRAVLSAGETETQGAIVTSDNAKTVSADASASIAPSDCGWIHHRDRTEVSSRPSSALRTMRLSSTRMNWSYE